MYVCEDIKYNTVRQKKSPTVVENLNLKFLFKKKILLSDIFLQFNVMESLKPKIERYVI